MDGVGKELAQDTFDRITSSVLLALGYSFTLIEQWPQEEQDIYRNKLVDILDLKIEALPI